MDAGHRLALDDIRHAEFRSSRHPSATACHFSTPSSRRHSLIDPPSPVATTIDNLRVDHHITVLRDFTDAKGVAMRVGDKGILRKLHWDPIRMEIHLEIEGASRKVALVFPLSAKTGPRNGHMREYFEVGDDATAPRIIPAFHHPAARQMIIPPPAEHEPAPAHVANPAGTTNWRRAAQTTEGPDRLVDVENEMRQSIDHIGVAGSIAEIYAERMRAFQRAGNEPRAIAAFKLAVEWMGIYASSATSGGEGAALSYEYDRFRTSLAREFGYDPLHD